jgi:tRNA (mo5U34)-methyltransferase
MSCLDPARVWPILADTPLYRWQKALEPLVTSRYQPQNNRDLAGWYGALAALPAAIPSQIDLQQPCLQIGSADDLAAGDRPILRQQLMALHPWRKGPFCLLGEVIDTEWRSDWKWARLAPHIAPLHGRRILDVGCGNGYYGWRMIGSGAALVVGLDPTMRYVMQYHAIDRYLPTHHNLLLPLTLEEAPSGEGTFDTLFSMGVIYHRRDPLEHLTRLYHHLRPGGELILEGLIIAGDGDDQLTPPGRYAKMKNVFALPTVQRLQRWLNESGFTAIRCIDITPTRVAEQRRTPWMTFESLSDYLDPRRADRTVEGHPAPLRAILIAGRPHH